MELNAQNLLTSAINFEIELPNGETSNVVTIFNGSEVNFEELVRNTYQALANKTNGIKSVVASAGSIRGGVFKKHFQYSRLVY